MWILEMIFSFNFIVFIIYSVAGLESTVTNYGNYSTVDNDSAGDEAITIKEVCAKRDFLELERFLKEFDTPEVTISKTAETDDQVQSHLCNNEKYELLPFGKLPVDWKRLRLLYNVLSSPEDEELKSKLSIVYNILIIANQRINNHEFIHKGFQKSGDVSMGNEKILNVTTENYNTEELEDMNDVKKREEEGERNLLNTITNIEKTGTQSLTTSSSTVHLQRFERSTHNEENYDPTDSTLNYEYSSGFSEPPEIDLNLENKNFDKVRESGDNDSKKLIPQIEELEMKFKDSASAAAEGLGDEFYISPEVNEFFEKVTTRNEVFEKLNSSEKSSTAESKEVKTAENYDSNSLRTEDDEGNNNNNNNNQRKVTSAGFENQKIGDLLHVTTSETIKEMRSNGESELPMVTAKEIKPDLRKEDFETTIIRTTTPAALSERFTSPLSSLIDKKEKEEEKETLKFLERSFSDRQHFSTPSFVVLKKKILQNSNSIMNERTEETPVSFLEENSSIPVIERNEKESEFHFYESTEKTLILNIAEAFSNVPKPVKVVSIKNFGPHISRVNNFRDGKDSRIINSRSEDDNDDGDELVERDFDNRNKYNLIDINEESAGGNYHSKKLSSSGYLRNNYPAATSSGRTYEKRSRLNNDVEKLYRWFYRGGQERGESDPRDGIQEEIECKYKN